MTAVDDFLNYQVELRDRGVIYRAIGGRCEPDLTGYTDCSGLQCAALHHVGVPTPEPCMNSGGQWAWCMQAGTTMPIDVARVTRGAWLFLGFRGNEHIAVSWGDGRQFAAHSPSLGLGFAPFDVHSWYGAAWPPGLPHDGPAPAPHQPQPVPVEDDVPQLIVQIRNDTPHYVTDGKFARHLPNDGSEDVLVATGLAIRNADNTPIIVDRDFINNQRIVGARFDKTVPGDGK